MNKINLKLLEWRFFGILMELFNGALKKIMKNVSVSNLNDSARKLSKDLLIFLLITLIDIFN